MTALALPALYALFVWWFSTGAILYLDGLPSSTFRWSMAGATVLLAGAAWGLVASRADPTPAGAYLAFTSGLVVWAWLEMTYYMGFVTGPRREACVDGCSGWRHFGHAVQASLYHELATLGLAALLLAATWGMPNQVGLWTFVVLWWMQLSAKLNVFLGVPNLSEEFLPEHLAFLKSFLTRKPMNLLFPVSVTVSVVVTTLLVQTALAPGATPFDTVGFAFLAVLAMLAILEHWFLVLPLPVEALWRWSLKSRPSVETAAVQAPPPAPAPRDAEACPRCAPRLDAAARPLALSPRRVSDKTYSRAAMAGVLAEAILPQAATEPVARRQR